MAQSTKQPLENGQAYQTLLITLFDAAKASAGLADKAASLLYEAQCRIEDAAELYSEAHIHAEKATTYLYAAIDECRAYIRDDDDPHAIKPSPPKQRP